MIYKCLKCDKEFNEFEILIHQELDMDCCPFCNSIDILTINEDL